MPKLQNAQLNSAQIAKIRQDIVKNRSEISRLRSTNSRLSNMSLHSVDAHSERRKAKKLLNILKTQIDPHHGEVMPLTISGNPNIADVTAQQTYNIGLDPDLGTQDFTVMVGRGLEFPFYATDATKEGYRTYSVGRSFAKNGHSPFKTVPPGRAGPSGPLTLAPSGSPGDSISFQDYFVTSDADVIIPPKWDGTHWGWRINSSIEAQYDTLPYFSGQFVAEDRSSIDIIITLKTRAGVVWTATATPNGSGHWEINFQTMTTGPTIDPTDHFDSVSISYSNTDSTTNHVIGYQTFMGWLLKSPTLLFGQKNIAFDALVPNTQHYRQTGGIATVSFMGSDFKNGGSIVAVALPEYWITNNYEPISDAEFARQIPGSTTGPLRNGAHGIRTYGLEKDYLFRSIYDNALFQKWIMISGTIDDPTQTVKVEFEGSYQIQTKSRNFPNRPAEQEKQLFEMAGNILAHLTPTSENPEHVKRQKKIIGGFQRILGTAGKAGKTLESLQPSLEALAVAM